MKILISHFYNPSFQLGGASRGVLDMTVALHQKPGYEIRVLLNDGPLADELKKAGVSYALIPRSKVRTSKILRGMREMIDSFRPDVIHSHHRFATFLFSTFFKKWAPILHTERVIQKDKVLLAKFGTLVVTVSESVRQNLIKRYKVPENRVRTIRNAVRFRKADPAAVEKLKKEFPKQPHQLFLLCVGRFEKQKAHMDLVHAAALLPENYRNRMRIFLAGEGELENALKNEIRKKDLEKNFIFLGYRQDIPEWLQVADALVLPSLWEGLPRVVIEAFYSGKTALATNIPETSEIVENGSNGILVPPKDPEAMSQAFKKMMDEPETLKRYAAKALETGRSFSFESMIEKYCAVYQELAQTRKK
jgi:glycosyltransferase involved in cell wall biosynthesis